MDHPFSPWQGTHSRWGTPFCTWGTFCSLCSVFVLELLHKQVKTTWLTFKLKKNKTRRSIMSLCPLSTAPPPRPANSPILEQSLCDRVLHLPTILASLLCTCPRLSLLPLKMWCGAHSTGRSNDITFPFLVSILLLMLPKPCLIFDGHIILVVNYPGKSISISTWFK